MGRISELSLSFTLAAAACGCAGVSARPVYRAPSPPATPHTIQAETPVSQSLPSNPRPQRREPVIVDDAAIVIREAGDQYLLGEEAYRSGDLDRAREHFDAAVMVLMKSGLDVQDEPRLRDAFARLIQDIQSLEAEALRSAEDAGRDEDRTPLEDLKDITSFLTPEELAIEMAKIRPPTEADQFSIPVVLNERVLTFIEAFQKQFRKPFVGGYQRMGQYEEMIRRTLREEGLPEDLIYVAFIESTFKPNAYSRARAKGVWQFMASTGARYGLVRNAYLDERSDPEKATRAAALYLKDLYAMFGDWYVVMAAYNAGEGVPLRAIDRTGKKDFWELAKTRYFRTETKNFVPSILALSIMSRDPARYGFEGLAKDAPVEFDRVTMDGPTELSLVARLTGATVEEIQRLNPQLTRAVTPPGPGGYSLRVPRGSGPSFQAAYAALPPQAKIAVLRSTSKSRKGAVVRSASTDGTYVVRPGDTLSDIARRHGTTVQQITSLNGISDPSKLMPGQVLTLSVAVNGSARRRSASPPPSKKSDVQAADSQRRVSHKVRAGDSLYRIAARYRTSVENLREWNGMGDRSRIHPGDVLTVYLD